MAFLLFLLFFFLFYKFIKRRDLLVAFLFFFYALTFGMSMVLNQYEDQHVAVIPALYVGFVLLFWFLPFQGVRPDLVSHLAFNKKHLYIIAVILIVIHLTAISESIARLGQFLSLDNFSRAKRIVSSEGFYEDAQASGLAGYLILFRPLYVINLALFFIFMKNGWSKLLTTLLLLTSCSYLLHDITAFGRDAMVFWPLNFGILFFLFAKSLSRRQCKRIKVGMVILLSIVCCAFLFITFTRFGDQMIEFLISYGGQQLGNFCDAWDIDIAPYSILPKTSETVARNLFGITLHRPDPEALLDSIGQSSEYNVFGYFLKEFIWSVGRVGTLVLSYFFYVFTTVIRNGFLRYKDIWSFLILILLFQVPLHGMFYYRQLLSWDFAYVCFLLFAVSMHARVIYCTRKSLSYACK